MKFIGNLVSLIIKLTVLVAGVVVAMEAIDILAEKKQSRYLISQDFEE